MKVTAVFFGCLLLGLFVTTAAWMLALHTLPARTVIDFPRDIQLQSLSRKSVGAMAIGIQQSDKFSDSHFYVPADEMSIGLVKLSGHEFEVMAEQLSEDVVWKFSHSPACSCQVR